MTTTSSANAATWQGAPSAHDDEVLERSYERYVARTRVSWLAIVCVLFVGSTKIPHGFALSPALRVPLFDLPVLLIPIIAAILGATRCAADFRHILRGRSSWGRALTWTIAVGGLGFLVHTALIYALGGTVAAPLPPDSGYAAQLFVLLAVSPVVEEFIFQVVLQTRLSRLGIVTSILGTTLAFALFHLSAIDRLPSLNELYNEIPMFFGLLAFAIMRRYNGSLAGLLAAHALSNALAIQIDPYLSRLP